MQPRSLARDKRKGPAKNPLKLNVMISVIVVICFNYTVSCLPVQIDDFRLEGLAMHSVSFEQLLESLLELGLPGCIVAFVFVDLVE